MNFPEVVGTVSHSQLSDGNVVIIMKILREIDISLNE